MPPAGFADRQAQIMTVLQTVFSAETICVCFKFWRFTENSEGADYDGDKNIIRRIRIMTQNKLNPVHPGEVLLEEFLKPMGLSREQLASDIGVAIIRIDKIIAEKDRISADVALRLARYFGTSPRFWTGLQADYDLDVTAETLGNRLEQEVKIRPGNELPGCF